MLRSEPLQLVETEDSPFLGPALRLTTRADDLLTCSASARSYLQDDFGPMLAEKLEFETTVEFPEPDWAPEGTAAGVLLRSVFLVLKGCKWPVFELGHFTASPGAEGEDSLLGQTISGGDTQDDFATIPITIGGEGSGALAPATRARSALRVQISR